jgi:hypothetical protein
VHSTILDPDRIVVDALLDVRRRLELTDTDLWLILEREPAPDSPFLGALPGRTVVAPKTFDQWNISTVPHACVVSEAGKVDAKGELRAVGRRLREALGLSPIIDEEQVLAEGVQA